MKSAFFSPDLFVFFRELKENNDKAWFESQKKRYEREVKEPFARFIEAFAPRLETISAHFLADKRSFFRIHRDVRFSRDKSPYKTHAAAQFRHEEARNIHAPGFYLHLEPGMVFLGAGLYHPEPAAAHLVRQALDARPKRWKEAVADLELGGESLKRPPSGFSKDHPLIEDLKRKDFIATRTLTEKQACQADFLDRFEAFCRQTSPFMGLLTGSLGLAY